jgi:hypothetical protein
VPSTDELECPDFELDAMTTVLRAMFSPSMTRYALAPPDTCRPSSPVRASLLHQPTLAPDLLIGVSSQKHRR